MTWMESACHSAQLSALDEPRFSLAVDRRVLTTGNLVSCVAYIYNRDRKSKQKKARYKIGVSLSTHAFLLLGHNAAMSIDITMGVAAVLVDSVSYFTMLLRLPLGPSK